MSIIPSAWLQEHFPLLTVQPVSNLFPDGTLQLTAANNTTIPYLGYVEFPVCLDQPGKSEIEVPFLVAKGEQDSIILGYNVISEAVKGPLLQEDVHAILTTALQSHSRETVTAVINTIHEEESNPRPVKSGRKTQRLRPGINKIRCTVHAGPLKGKMVLLEPVDTQQLPEGVEIQPALTGIGGRRYGRVDVIAVNQNRTDVFIPKQTTMKWLHICFSEQKT